MDWPTAFGIVSIVFGSLIFLAVVLISLNQRGRKDDE